MFSFYSEFLRFIVGPSVSTVYRFGIQRKRKEVMRKVTPKTLVIYSKTKVVSNII